MPVDVVKSEGPGGVELHAVPTYQAVVHVGLREGYDGPVRGAWEVQEMAQAYCDKVGLAVTVTETRFVYKGGREPGVSVGLLCYPRFPREPASIKAHAVELACRLRTLLKQERVSVACTDETIMVGPR
jgi:hypothetical protein